MNLLMDQTLVRIRSVNSPPDIRSPPRTCSTRQTGAHGVFQSHAKLTVFVHLTCTSARSLNRHVAWTAADRIYR